MEILKKRYITDLKKFSSFHTHSHTNKNKQRRKNIYLLLSFTVFMFVSKNPNTTKSKFYLVEKLEVSHHSNFA